MDVSATELTAMVQKAARGAGWPLGQAEELAAASVHLAAMGEDAAGIASAALSSPMGLEMAGFDLAYAEGRAEVEAPDQRLLTAYAALAERAYETGFAIKRAGPKAEITRIEATASTPPPIRRVNVSPKDWTALSTLAAKTYVPASAASRAAGAGAGDIDND